MLKHIALKPAPSVAFTDAVSSADVVYVEKSPTIEQVSYTCCLALESRSRLPIEWLDKSLSETFVTIIL